MVVLEEDRVSPECDEVYYQTPEELKVQGNPDPDVVHDDTDPIDDVDIPIPDELDGGSSSNEDEIISTPASTTSPSDIEKPEEEDFTPPTTSPLDAVRMTKSNPNTISITKLNGKYYIDHNDLKCYMDACGERDYESALNSIISAHEQDDLTSDNIGIVMSENDLLNLDPETKLAMEASDIDFEVFAN